MQPLDQKYLMRLVRRVLVERVRGQADHEPAFVPLSLQELQCRASVTLRRDGRLVSTEDLDSLPVVQACQAAAKAALDAAQQKMIFGKHTVLPVTSGGHLVGIISQNQISRFLTMHKNAG